MVGLGQFKDPKAFIEDSKDVYRWKMFTTVLKSTIKERGKKYR